MFIRFILQYAAVGVTALTVALPAQASNPLVIKTDQGKVQGKMSADSQTRDFLGIPFAASPVGPLRWKPPQPAAKWQGVRQATVFGHALFVLVDEDVSLDALVARDALTVQAADARRRPDLINRGL